ncbi:hypothetical protein OEZ85_013064 [Tetradesmus obliquus]|uniref:Uncharacterized protein n=1 Tax=Tetradesmus obliquus TaxID=3088 RepID=A0ABY8U9P4_TETOB|nr:hypothetical protein OEZ85_013064 [Tetradesmus obliquus]
MAKPMKKAKQQKQQQRLPPPPVSDSDDEMLGYDSEGDEIFEQQQQQQRGIPQLAAEAARRAAGYAAAQAAAAAAAGGSDDEDEEDEEESDDGSDDEAAAAAGPGARRHIYNADALHEKLEDMAWTGQQPWEEGLVVTSLEPTAVADVDDDLERELAFYNQALSATVEAIGRFQAAGKPWLRPPDYYAEMVKSDEQMARIKDRLMYEQQQIDQAAERRKAREQKAYAKQVQAEKVKERAQEKKRQISQVQQLRKQREKSGFAGELDFDAEMSGAARRQQQPQQQRGQRAGVRIQAGATPTKKRQMKDAKFGFGGRKRLQKQNDAFSAADMSGYKPGRFDDGPAGKKKGGGFGGGKKGGLGAKGGVKKGGKGGGNRPGKARRQQMKQRKG